jgi:hypothetical protein
LVGFAGEKRFGYRAIFDGVVVSARSAARLNAAIYERRARAQTPAAASRRGKARRARPRREREWLKRCRSLGIDAGGQTARWLKDGDIDSDLAELIGFKARYRHEFTDYDQRFSNEDFAGLREAGYSPSEAREEMRAEARNFLTQHAVPGTWPEYLDRYGFRSAVAQALVRVLAEPTRCHPVWFKEAEIAVRRQGLALDSLAYEAVKRAIDDWRRER